MTNQEIIRALRCAATVHTESIDCSGCPLREVEEIPEEFRAGFGGRTTWESCNADKAMLAAAAAIEALSASLAAARAGRDAAVADLSSVLGDIENIRQRYGIDNADADDALSCICEDYCVSAGRMCYKEGNRCQCENFRWCGAAEGGKAE